MVYIEREGRQFGIESIARVRKQMAGVAPDVVLHEIATAFFAFPVLRCRLWALTHGYGFVPVR
jgi:hypothetical protein